MLRLRQAVEDKVSFMVSTSRGFELLSEAISGSGSGYLSASTLKRRWGYVRDTPRKHTSTLDVLARFVGFNGGIVEFMRHCDALTEAESGYSTARTLDMASLPVGSRVMVAWMPDRKIVLSRKEGGSLFEIVEALNSKLKVGMKVRVGRIVEGSPLMLELVDDDKHAPLVYEAGKLHGVTWRLLENDDNVS